MLTHFRYVKALLCCGLVAMCGVNSLQAGSLPVEAYERLERIRAKFKLIHGDINVEVPEQLLAAYFMPSDAKVLEIGADVGRNSCVIASILDDSSQMVSLEVRDDAIRCLKGNRDYNGLKFHIKHAALSKVPLIMRGWITIPSNIDQPGYTRINTVTFEELMSEYGIPFDTLVVDCEGALYYILRDDPMILDNIRMIFIENDFQTDEHQRFVADLFTQKGFSVIHNEGPPYRYEHSFHQVWSR